jgi:hypothetical protein
MTKRLACLALLLVTGCSAGSTAVGGSTTSPTTTSPATTSPTTASPTTGPPPAAAGTGSVPATGPAASTGAGSKGGSQTAVPAEHNPPGDIPDNVAYVPYSNTAGRFTFRHPEGWAETTRTSQVTFTDKLNGVQVLPGTDTTPPTVAIARSRDVAALTGSQAAFELRSITAVTEPGGVGVHIVYRRNSAPDPVTGRQYRDEVERYELVANGREVVMELYGPVGADNVDAYRTMVQSLRLS